MNKAHSTKDATECKAKVGKLREEQGEERFLQTESHLSFQHIIWFRFLKGTVSESLRFDLLSDSDSLVADVSSFQLSFKNAPLSHQRIGRELMFM